MTGIERSRQQAEEAQDALTMHRLMEAEGQALLRIMEELEQDETFELPPGLTERCLQTLSQRGREPRRCGARRRAITLFRYVAAAVLVASLLFLTAFATIAEVREGTLQFLVEVTGSYTRYKLVPQEDSLAAELPDRMPSSDVETLLGYRFPQMPEDFALISEQKSTNQALARYQREDGAEIHVTVRHFLSGTTSAHTGDADVQSVIVQGYEGQLIRRNYLLPDGQAAPWSQLLWGNTEAGVMVSIIGYRIEGSVLMELAETAEWVGPLESTVQPTLMGYRLPQPPEGFRLESYGETDLAHYATYRKNSISGREIIYFRISEKPFQFEDYVKPGASYGSLEINKNLGIKVNYFAYRRVTSGATQKQPSTILLWKNAMSRDDKARYIWLEGCNVPEETLLDLAEKIQYRNR